MRRGLDGPCDPGEFAGGAARGVTCVKGDRHGEIVLSESQVERMTRQKVARWTVDGIGLAGILSGGLLVFAALGVLLGMEREALGALCGSLFVSAAWRGW